MTNDLLHPGAYLKGALSTKIEEINVKHVAEALHVNRSQMSAIFNSRSLISPLMAVKLELVYGLSAEDILNYQNLYLIQTAKAELKDKKMKLVPITK